MARIYSVNLLSAGIAPGAGAVVVLPDPYTWVVRWVSAIIVNQIPDTGGGALELLVDSLLFGRWTFPGAFEQTVNAEYRIVAPGPSTLSAQMSGGSSASAQVSISGYQLTP